MEFRSNMSDRENRHPKIRPGMSFMELAGSVPPIPGREDVDLDTIIAEATEAYFDERMRRFHEENCLLSEMDDLQETDE
jgi:hypothetical protein